MCMSLLHLRRQSIGWIDVLRENIIWYILEQMMTNLSIQLVMWLLLALGFKNILYERMVLLHLKTMKDKKYYTFLTFDFRNQYKTS